MNAHPMHMRVAHVSIIVIVMSHGMPQDVMCTCQTSCMHAEHPINDILGCSINISDHD